MKPEDMSNEQLASELERHASIIREDWVTDAVYVAEAARRLRSQPEPRKRPERAVRVIIEIGGDSWKDVLQDLSWITDEAERSGRVSSGVMGGPSSGNIRTVIENPEMTHEKYHAALDEYLSRTANEAKEKGHG